MIVGYIGLGVFVRLFEPGIALVFVMGCDWALGCLNWELWDYAWDSWDLVLSVHWLRWGVDVERLEEMAVVGVKVTGRG